MPESLPLPDVEGAEFSLFRIGTCKLISWCWEAGELTLHYKVYVVTTRLDAYNFVMDNMLVENYFRDNFEGRNLEASCELIAANALVAFCCKVPYCSQISVAVSGNPDKTWLTAKLTDPEKIRRIAEAAKQTETERV
jgi:hypothetical protein